MARIKEATIEIQKLHKKLCENPTYLMYILSGDLTTRELSFGGGFTLYGYVISMLGKELFLVTYNNRRNITVFFEPALQQEQIIIEKFLAQGGHKSGSTYSYSSKSINEIVTFINSCLEPFIKENVS